MKRKQLTYQQFCRKFFFVHPDLQTIKKLQKEHNFKIVDLHNIIDAAKRDNRL